MTNTSIAQLSDRELLDRLSRIAADQRAVTVDLLALMGEVDARRLYLPEGCASLFTYCTRVMHFSEDEAYHRIAAARAARKFPMLLDRIRDGSVSLTVVTVLAPHLTSENADALISAAVGKNKREVEHQMASLAPRPDVKSIVRRLPEPKPIHAGAAERPPAETSLINETCVLQSTVASSTPRAISSPLSGDRYLLRVTLSGTAHEHLRRAQDLMRHSVANGDPATIVARALELLVDDLERRRIANVKTPRGPRPHDGTIESGSRHVPAAVRRDVWKRDGGRCAFVGTHGRCTETGQLEFHHVEAFAFGGPTTTTNIELRCRAHNQYEGALLFPLDGDGLDAVLR